MKNNGKPISRFVSFVKGTDMSDGFVSKAFTVELVGRRRVIIECAERILQYACDSVRIGTADGTVAVIGEELALKSYMGGIIAVDGRIGGVYFE